MITVEQGQSLLDVAMQHCGDATAAFDIALLNGLSITDDVAPGTQLVLSEVLEASIVKFFSDNNIVPATAGVIAVESEEVLEGIDYWAIEQDFIVS